MSKLFGEAINTALNNPQDWRVAILVIVVLIIIGLFTGFVQKIIEHFFKNEEPKQLDRNSQSQKITIVGSYNTIEGQTVGTEMGIQKEDIKDKTHIRCQIETLTIDSIGDGLSVVFIENCYFAPLKEICRLCAKSKIIHGVYDFTEDQVTQLPCLFRLFNPNGITISYTDNLKTAIAKELGFRDISLEILTAIEIAKRLPFQKLKNNHFGVNNHSLGVFVNKK